MHRSTDAVDVKFRTIDDVPPPPQLDFVLDTATRGVGPDDDNDADNNTNTSATSARQYIVQQVSCNNVQRSVELLPANQLMCSVIPDTDTCATNRNNSHTSIPPAAEKKRGQLERSVQMATNTAHKHKHRTHKAHTPYHQHGFNDDDSQKKPSASSRNTNDSTGTESYMCVCTMQVSYAAHARSRVRPRVHSRAHGNSETAQNVTDIAFHYFVLSCGKIAPLITMFISAQRRVLIVLAYRYFFGA